MDYFLHFRKSPPDKMEFDLNDGGASISGPYGVGLDNDYENNLGLAGCDDGICGGGFGEDDIFGGGGCNSGFEGLDCDGDRREDRDREEFDALFTFGGGRGDAFGCDLGGFQQCENGFYDFYNGDEDQLCQDGINDCIDAMGFGRGGCSSGKCGFDVGFGCDDNEFDDCSDCDQCSRSSRSCDCPSSRSCSDCSDCDDCSECSRTSSEECTTFNPDVTLSFTTSTLSTPTSRQSLTSSKASSIVSSIVSLPREPLEMKTAKASKASKASRYPSSQDRTWSVPISRSSSGDSSLVQPDWSLTLVNSKRTNRLTELMKPSKPSRNSLTDSSSRSPRGQVEQSTLAILKDSALIPILDLDHRPILDACGYDGAIFALLDNGDVMKLVAKSDSKVLREYLVTFYPRTEQRMTRLLKFGGYLYGLGEDGSLYILDGRSYKKDSLVWSLVPWAPREITDISTTLQGEHVWMISQDVGTVYEAVRGDRGKQAKPLERVSAKHKMRIYGLTNQDYLEINRKTWTAEQFPDQEIYEGIYGGALTHEGDIVRIPESLRYKLIAIRIINWEPIYIVRL